MRTFTLNPPGESPAWLKRALFVLQKNLRLKSLVIMLFCCFLLPAVSLGQTADLKKGYSKADYLAAFGNQQEKKAVLPEQIDEKCGFIYVEEMLKQKYPNRQTTEQFEKWMRQSIANGNYDASRAITVIPVVVHVIHNGESVGSGANISDDQVLSQLVVLNEDFRRMNGDAGNTPLDFLPVAADGELEFCLATVDPDGNTINGIDRYDGGRASYSMSDMENNIKPATAWHPEYYFNIWVAPLQGGLLGYAQFPSASTLPGMPVDGGPDYTDGIVVRDFAFGTTGTALAPWNLGRTATHEAGHFFGLRHNGGDGGCGVDDFVTDTPTQIGQNNNLESDCSYPDDNDCIDPAPDYPDMFMNYMDYSDDACMNLFTLGQKERFDVVLANSPRRSYELSQVCNGVQPPEWVVVLPEPPANDLCENAIPISCGESVDGSTADATNIDAPDDCIAVIGDYPPGFGVWYTIEGTGGIIELSTCNNASYDTRIDLYTGDCGDLTCITGNDDGPGCAGFTSELTFTSDDGVTYYIYVSGWSSAVGDFTLNVTCVEPPANDLCEDAIELQCGDVVSGNTELATDTDAQDDCFDVLGDLPPGFGVWYTIEGTGSDITLSTCDDANYDTRIDLYSGACGDLTCIDGNDDALGCTGLTSELTFASEVGVTYYVYVSGWSSAVGDFNLTVDCACVADAGDCATVYWGYEPAECTDLTANGNYGTPPYSYEWNTLETTQTITVCPTSTTTYTVTVTDADGCVSTDEVTVDVVDVRCGKKMNKVEICHIPPGNPDNPQLLCVSANAVEAHLAHGDHLGACGIEPCDGLYSGNSGSGERQIITNTPIVSDDDWNIYPNPAYDRASIDLSVLYGNEVQVTIYDASGKAFWNYPTQILESPVIEIDMNSIPSGIYHVVLRTETQSMVKKLVITK